MKRYFDNALRHQVIGKLADYGSKKVAHLHSIWQDQMSRKRVAQRHHVFVQAGGNKASIISYGLRKAGKE